MKIQSEINQNFLWCKIQILILLVYNFVQLNNVYCGRDLNLTESRFVLILSQITYPNAIIPIFLITQYRDLADMRHDHIHNVITSTKDVIYTINKRACIWHVHASNFVSLNMPSSLGEKSWNQIEEAISTVKTRAVLTT